MAEDRKSTNLGFQKIEWCAPSPSSRLCLCSVLPFAAARRCKAQAPTQWVWALSCLVVHVCI